MADGAFVVCSDANWLWQSAFVLQQAIDSDPQGRLDYFYATDFDTDRLPLAGLLDPRVKVLNLAADLDKVVHTQNHHVPKATFMRFLALDWLATRFRKVIYADGDLFLSWGSWAELLDLPASAHAVTATSARPVWFNHPRMRYGRRYRAALCPAMGDRYLNAGVLLVNTERFLADGVSSGALEFYRDNKELCQHGDQSALNAVLAGTWEELSPSWNWQVSSFNFPLLARFNPRVIHFTGPVKPWNDRYQLFSTARDRMCRFLRDRDAGHIADRVTKDCTPEEPPMPRRAQFRATWMDDGDVKFSRISRYLGRTDFADTKAGLPMFAEGSSGFGTAPASDAQLADGART